MIQGRLSRPPNIEPTQHLDGVDGTHGTTRGTTHGVDSSIDTGLQHCEQELKSYMAGDSPIAATFDENNSPKVAPTEGVAPLPFAVDMSRGGTVCSQLSVSFFVTIFIVFSFFFPFLFPDEVDFTHIHIWNDSFFTLPPPTHHHHHHHYSYLCLHRM